MTTIANLFPNGDTKRLANWINVEAVRLSKLRDSGIIATNGLFDQRAGQAGNITSVPFVGPLDGDSVVGSDDLSAHIAAGGLTGDEFLAVRHFRNKAWSGASLASMVTGLDIMSNIASKVAAWRALDEQKVALATLNGVLADAVANEASSFVIGDGTTKLDGAMVVDAQQLKGERKDMMNILIIHSAVHARLQKDNMLANVAGSDQNVGFQTYLGNRIVVSDAMAPVDGVYTSILCGAGVLAYGEAAPERGALAVVASETAGNGSGGDTLIARRVYIMNPVGYSYTGSANPTNANLANAANYVRKLDPALIPLSFIKSDLS